MFQIHREKKSRHHRRIDQVIRLYTRYRERESKRGEQILCACVNLKSINLAAVRRPTRAQSSSFRFPLIFKNMRRRHSIFHIRTKYAKYVYVSYILKFDYFLLLGGGGGELITYLSLYRRRRVYFVGGVNHFLRCPGWRSINMTDICLAA